MKIFIIYIIQIVRPSPSFNFYWQNILNKLVECQDIPFISIPKMPILKKLYEKSKN